MSDRDTKPTDIKLVRTPDGDEYKYEVQLAESAIERLARNEQ